MTHIYNETYNNNHFHHTIIHPFVPSHTIRTFDLLYTPPPFDPFMHRPSSFHPSIHLHIHPSPIEQLTSIAEEKEEDGVSDSNSNSGSSGDHSNSMFSVYDGVPRQVMVHRRTHRMTYPPFVTIYLCYYSSGSRHFLCCLI